MKANQFIVASLGSIERSIKRIAIAALLLLSTTAWAGPFEDAVAAHNRQDYATALQLFRSLAEQGHVTAQHNLGSMYKDGLGVAARDYAEALKWYRLAAEQGDSGAQNSIGVMYKDGLGVEQNYKEAWKWLLLATRQRNANAYFNSGTMFHKGLGVRQDFKAAAKSYLRAAENGHVRGQVAIGIMYEKGQGVMEDHISAHMWFILAAAAGDAEAIKYRDYTGARLVPNNLRKAQIMAQDCLKRNFKYCEIQW